MSAIDTLVKINISQQTTAVAKESFSIPLIVGPTNPGWTGGTLIKSFTDAASMLLDGYTTSSPEYIYALKLMSQEISPTIFYVGYLATGVIATDLANIIAQNNSWYGITLCEHTDQNILDMAAAVNALKKIFIAVSAASGIPTSSTGDVLSQLKALSYTRTALMYTPEDTEGKEAAWVGGQLPQTPGSNNWAYKTLLGCTTDVLSDNARSIIIGTPVAGILGKNGNVYTTIGGQNITQMGIMVGGQYIDITIGIDWLESTLQSNIYQALVDAAKIPYTDDGTNILIQAVNSAIQEGVTNGLIDGKSPITVTAPLVASVSSTQRANRIAPTITFKCRLQGAFNAVDVSGTVTV
jgi:hypothetical protein